MFRGTQSSGSKPPLKCSRQYSGDSAVFIHTDGRRTRSPPIYRCRLRLPSDRQRREELPRRAVRKTAVRHATPRGRRRGGPRSVASTSASAILAVAIQRGTRLSRVPAGNSGRAGTPPRPRRAGRQRVGIRAPGAWNCCAVPSPPMIRASPTFARSPASVVAIAVGGGRSRRRRDAVAFADHFQPALHAAETPAQAGSPRRRRRPAAQARRAANPLSTLWSPSRSAIRPCRARRRDAIPRTNCRPRAACARSLEAGIEAEAFHRRPAAHRQHFAQALVVPLTISRPRPARCGRDDGTGAGSPPRPGRCRRGRIPGC